jgi:hypothetical protein
MNYRHRISGHVIDESYYRKLPFDRKSEFECTYDEPTHFYEDENRGIDLFGAAIIASAMSFDDIPSLNLGSDDSQSSDFDFGGGDFGGAGAGCDW